MLLMTGADMVVMRKRMAAAKRRNVPTWWRIPVAAILFGFEEQSEEQQKVDVDANANANASKRGLAR